MKQLRGRLQRRFEQFVEEIRRRPGYHCVVAWSGGKDSTYTLWSLKQQFGLTLLAFTFDNSFVSPEAFRNMRTVAENLGVDHIIVKPRFDLLREVFVGSMQPGLYPRRALERASSICNSCMAFAKGIGLRIALEKRVPLIVYGWSPGQVPMASAFFQTNRKMLQAMVEASKAPLATVTQIPLDAYFPDETLLNWADEASAIRYPVLAAPLAFLDYDEDAEMRAVQALGWERPLDTDPNSTNCLLNMFASQTHLQDTGYHPYVMELAALVRNGYMTREEALKRLQARPSAAVVAAVTVKLGLSHPPPSR